MRVLGIDPDTKNTGLAIVENGKVLWVGVASAKGRTAADRREGMAEALTNAVYCHVPGVPDRIAIEWQAIRPCDPRPNDILGLAAVAGMALACTSCFDLLWGEPRIYLPLPVEWKGSIPKEVHQRRILKAAGLNDRLEGVPGATALSKIQCNHVIDAIGLALWAARQR